MFHFMMKILIVFIERRNPKQIKKHPKKVKFFIVKVRCWKSRQHFSDAKLKHFSNRKRKPGQHLFSLLVNLTRRRYLLLNKAKELIEDSETIDNVFAEVNCPLELKFQNGGLKYFNSKNEHRYFINNWIIGNCHWHIYAFRNNCSGFTQNTLCRGILIDCWIAGGESFFYKCEGFLKLTHSISQLIVKSTRWFLDHYLFVLVRLKLDLYDWWSPIIKIVLNSVMPLVLI